MTPEASLGPLPGDWLVMRLGEVTERGAQPVEVAPDVHYREIGIRSHGKGIFHKEPVLGSTLGAKRVFRVQPDCLVFNIVFAWEGAVAVTSAAETGMIASHRFPMLAPTAERLVDVHFLRRFFQSRLGVRLLGDASPGGAGRNRTLGQKLLGEIPVPVPPLAEQKKIASILLSIDDAIESTLAVIDQLDAVKKAMMAELLTRGIPGRHTKFKMTEIGEVPAEWEVLPIQRVIDSCDYGLSKSLSAQPGSVAVLRMGNLAGGHVVLEELKYIDGSEVNEELLLAPGDVLFNRTNSKDLVGKVGVFHGAPFSVSFASYLLRLRPSAPHSGAWLSAAMNLESNQAALRAMATPGVSQVNINRGKMVEMRLPVPPPVEQHDIMKVAATLDERLATERAARSQLTSVKAALMSVLLNGEVRVKPIEKDA